MIKQDQPSRKSKIDISRQITSSASKKVDSNYMINEMKQLLKENTALKQENLLLKQQIMLSKIQIQNLTLKLEQTVTNNPQNFTINNANTEANTKEFSKKHVGRHAKLKSELYKQKYLQNERKSKEEDTLKIFKQEVLKEISQYSTAGNTTDKSMFQDRKVQCMSSRSTLIRRDEQLQTSTKSIKISREGKSLSRKQQIMNKYRPFLDLSNSPLVQKIETIKSRR